MVVKKQNTQPVLEIPRSFLEITLEIGVGIGLYLLLTLVSRYPHTFNFHLNIF